MLWLWALLLANIAIAQPVYRGEVYASLERSSVWDDEGSLGSGVGFAGTLGWRLTPKLGLELNVDHFNHKREFSFATVEGSGTFLTGDVMYHFRTGRVQPYVLGGGGFVHYVRESGFAPGPERSGNGPALNFAVGLKGFITERISIRPEWRLGYATNISAAFEPPLYYQRISVGVGYRW
jgi:hypothetical protein